MQSTLPDTTQLLAAKLFRHRCPSSLMLGDYCVDLLNSAEQQQITTHAQRCPHCRHELAIFQRTLDLQPQREWRDRLRVWVAKPQHMVEGEPAYALRGEANEPQLFSAENDVQIAINVQPDHEHSGYHAVIGMIIGADSSDFSIDLWLDGRLIDQVSANQLGNFHLTHLAPGDYELIIKGASFLLHIQTLTIQ